MGEAVRARKASVVVPVYNGRPTIRATVECIVGQSLPPDEILIVDDGSTDGTPEFLKDFGDRINLLRQPNGGPASARNRGIRASSGEFVAFTDSDCLPDKDWLAGLLRGFDDPRVAGVGGITTGVAGGGVSEYVDLIRLLNPVRTAAGDVDYFVTANACFRRDVLIEVGLFSEKFRKPGGEDPELCRRMRSFGYKLKAVDDAVVLHHHKQTVRNLLKTMANYGEGLYVLENLLPEYAEKIDHRKQLVGCPVAMRSMVRRGLQYLPKYGLRRAVLFSFLDHYRHAAFSWGYLKREKKESRDSSRRAAHYPPA